MYQQINNYTPGHSIVATLSAWFTSVSKQIGNCLDKTASQSSVYNQVYNYAYSLAASHMHIYTSLAAVCISVTNQSVSSSHS